MSTETGKTHGTGAQLLIPVVALLMLAGVGCSEKETSTTQEAAPAMESAAPEAAPPAEVTEPAPEPAAEPTEPQAAAEAAAESQSAAVDGQKIYQASCQACHAAGVAGAPKLSDKAAWVPRIAKGNDALMSSVKNGLNVMPPKGGCMSCSDDELRAAIEYMVAEGS